MQNKKNLVTSLCVGVAVLALAACGSAATPTAVPPTVAPAATAAPAATVTTAAAATTAGSVQPDPNSAKPTNAGDIGPAVMLTGDATAGAKIFVDNCKKCHGDEGKGGVSNPGSNDGTVPALNPIDDTIINKDAKVFAANIDLFVEHGSTPEGSKPQQVMAAFGDKKTLTPQQIADVIAYVISLNSK